MYDILNLTTYETRQPHHSAADFIVKEDDAGNITIHEMFDADFTISGILHMMPFFMSSANAKQNLFFPQYFSIFDMDTHYSTKRKNLASYELCYTLDGEGYLEYRNKSYTLKKGDGFFIDCQKYHFYKTRGSRWVTTVLHFNGIQAENYFDQFASSGHVNFSSANCPNFEIYQLNIMKLTARVAPYQEYQISCLFTLLLTDLLRGNMVNDINLKKVHPEVIEEVIRYIKEHYSEQIAFEELSKALGVSRSHLSREFKKYLGFSPKEYLIEYRLNQAKSLLRNTDNPISMVGSSVGFQDEAYFCHMFKKKEGITPLKFRNNALI